MNNKGRGRPRSASLLYVPIDPHIEGHPRTLAFISDLAGEEGIPPDLLPMYIVRLLLWAGQNAVDGNLGQLSPTVIALRLRWPNDPDTLYRALLVSPDAPRHGWLDVDENGEHRIHDWADYGGIAHKKRLDDAARQRRKSGRKKAVPQLSRNSHAIITQLSRGEIEPNEIKEVEEPIITQLSRNYPRDKYGEIENRSNNAVDNTQNGGKNRKGELELIELRPRKDGEKNYHAEITRRSRGDHADLALEVEEKEREREEGASADAIIRAAPGSWGYPVETQLAKIDALPSHDPTLIAAAIAETCANANSPGWPYALRLLGDPAWRSKNTRAERTSEARKVSSDSTGPPKPTKPAKCTADQQTKLDALGAKHGMGPCVRIMSPRLLRMAKGSITAIGRAAGLADAAAGDGDPTWAQVEARLKGEIV